jgi:hypothetical protein
MNALQVTAGRFYVFRVCQWGGAGGLATKPVAFCLAPQLKKLGDN